MARKQDQPKKAKTETKDMNRTLLLAAGGVILLIFVLFISGAGGTITGEAKGNQLKPECSDQVDNDGDGYCDYLTTRTRCRDGSIPGDADCASSTDNKEAPDCIPATEVCDGFDNNCNSYIDEGLPITCSSSVNCGTSGWTGSTYCGADGNVYRDYISYQCSFPGTCSSACSSQTTTYLQANCGTNGCLNGQCMNSTG